MSKALAISYNLQKIQKKTFFILALITLLLLGTYVYFVNQTVWNVVSRQNAVKEMQNLSSEIAALETSYMKSLSALTIEEAKLLGFKEITSNETTFVERIAPAVAVR